MLPSGQDAFSQLQQLAYVAEKKVNSKRGHEAIGLDANQKPVDEGSFEAEPQSYKSLMTRGYWDRRNVKTFDDAAARITPLLQQCAHAANAQSKVPVTVITGRKMSAITIMDEIRKLMDSDWGRLQQVKSDVSEFMQGLKQFDELGSMTLPQGAVTRGLESKQTYEAETLRVDQTLATIANKASPEYKTWSAYRDYLDNMHYQERIRLKIQRSIQDHAGAAKDRPAFRRALKELSRDCDLGKLASQTTSEGNPRNPISVAASNRLLNSLGDTATDPISLPGKTGNTPEQSLTFARQSLSILVHNYSDKKVALRGPLLASMAEATRKNVTSALMECVAPTAVKLQMVQSLQTEFGKEFNRINKLGVTRDFDPLAQELVSLKNRWTEMTKQEKEEELRKAKHLEEEKRKVEQQGATPSTLPLLKQSKTLASEGKRKPQEVTPLRRLEPENYDWIAKPLWNQIRHDMDTGNLEAASQQQWYTNFHDALRGASPGTRKRAKDQVLEAIRQKIEGQPQYQDYAGPVLNFLARLDQQDFQSEQIRPAAVTEELPSLEAVTKSLTVLPRLEHAAFSRELYARIGGDLAAQKTGQPEQTVWHQSIHQYLKAIPADQQQGALNTIVSHIERELAISRYGVSEDQKKQVLDVLKQGTNTEFTLSSGAGLQAAPVQYTPPVVPQKPVEDTGDFAIRLYQKMTESLNALDTQYQDGGLQWHGMLHQYLMTLPETERVGALGLTRAVVGFQLSDQYGHRENFASLERDFKQVCDQALKANFKQAVTAKVSTATALKESEEDKKTSENFVSDFYRKLSKTLNPALTPDAQKEWHQELSAHLLTHPAQTEQVLIQLRQKIEFELSLDIADHDQYIPVINNLLDQAGSPHFQPLAQTFPVQPAATTASAQPPQLDFHKVAGELMDYIRPQLRAGETSDKYQNEWARRLNAPLRTLPVSQREAAGFTLIQEVSNALTLANMDQHTPVVIQAFFNGISGQFKDEPLVVTVPAAVKPTTPAPVGPLPEATSQVTAKPKERIPAAPVKDPTLIIEEAIQKLPVKLPGVSLIEARPFLKAYYQVLFLSTADNYDLIRADRLKRQLEAHFRATRQGGGFDTFEYNVMQQVVQEYIANNSAADVQPVLTLTDPDTTPGRYNMLRAILHRALQNGIIQNEFVVGDPQDQVKQEQVELLEWIDNAPGLVAKLGLPKVNRGWNRVDPTLNTMKDNIRFDVQTEIANAVEFNESVASLATMNIADIANKIARNERLTQQELNTIVVARKALLDIQLGVGRRWHSSVLSRPEYWAKPQEHQAYMKMLEIDQLRSPEIFQAQREWIIKEHKSANRHPKVVIEGGGPIGLMSAISQFEVGGNVKVLEKRKFDFQRAQILRLDPIWIGMLKFYLGEKFYELFRIPEHPDTHNARGFIGKDSFGGLTTRDLEKALLDELQTLTQMAPSRDALVPVEQCELTHIEDPNDQHPGFTVHAKTSDGEKRFTDDVEVLICAGGKGSSTRNQYLPSKVVTNEEYYGVCTWEGADVQTDQFGHFEDFRQMIVCDRIFRGEFARQLNDDDSNRLLGEMSPKGQTAAQKIIGSGSRIFTTLSGRIAGTPLQTRCFENKEQFYIGMEIPSQIKDYLADAQRILLADGATEEDVRKLQLLIRTAWFQTVANSYGVDEKLNARKGAINKKFATTFSVAQDRTENNVIYKGGKVPLMITAAGDAAASPHFMSGTGLTSGRQHILDDQDYTRLLATGVSDIVMETQADDLRDKSDRTAAFAISRGSPFLQPLNH
ncbi:hypothetical protein [Endozoicomonas numazuensis]|uniref:Uncharacterized protein n=1 Tax=Endozoicomonas numazuensis TaxID=1137799 RepID=A0A081NLQ0_9GAMM|nr:hypothetical protein [Endozoicomonas numazuensis]KEQ19373.1 hypothetical protein GZ78_05265 [Endozoicomonas numazuensis]